ncbi:hypothetical protein D3C73_1057720 [compost metagenome]
MQKSILDKRLKRQSWYLLLQHGRIKIQFKPDAFPKTRLLDRGIFFDMGNFILQRNRLVQLLQAVSKQIRHGDDQIACSFGSFQQCQSGEHIKSVEQKMGIDLALERLKLQFLHKTLHFQALFVPFNENAEVSRHVLDSIREDAEFVIPAWLGADVQISCGDLLG